ncbi:hypothetical protein [Croceicoccus naphthovorans]|uniref:Uncharacterized protein n=1 Tax=Croceicoccus naphthovorans TaxID=1348774 RepID=A0A0G3XKT5_9SPHN|nr:hypothetical protein [Croceicoccus naphthovorans]AKM11199.1 hypothetical protein AB433_16430 [Croceicoccus naphthovorans]MBB3989906.1 hypothetical protein [Croceicoccus naphthovorans]
MRLAAPLLACAIVPLSGGCIAKTALDVATAPVRVASKAVDLATTSQSEADEKRGRELRKREERVGKLERRYAQEMDRCDAGDETACAGARATYAEIQAILPTIPVEPTD